MREKPARKAKLVDSCAAAAEPKKRGRPKHGKERPQAPTRLERQVARTSGRNVTQYQGTLDRMGTLEKQPAIARH